jgi:PAS domain S-box-containing protein
VSNGQPLHPEPAGEPTAHSALYLRLLIEAARDYAIFATDPARRITMWSAGAQRVFGYCEAEMIGQSADVIFTPEDRAAHAPEQESAEALLHGRADDERWHLKKNGDRFFASGVMTVLRDPDDRHLGFVKINRDLTERKLAEEQLRASRDELAARVQERTRELQESNDSLRAEIARRTASETSRAQLLRRFASVHEDERLRIAREMHDHLGQHIAALMWRLNELDARLANAAERSIVRETQQLAESIGHEVHALAVQLRPTDLDDLGLPGAISAFVDVWSRRSGVPVETQFVNLERDRLPRDTELALYRIVQEALTNILKHARATRVGIALTRVAAEVALTIEDDGVGFANDGPPAGNHRGLGLQGMQERAAAVGGNVEVESEPGRGTAVFVRVPLSPR